MKIQTDKNDRVLNAKLCPFCGKRPYRWDTWDETVKCCTKGCPASGVPVTMRRWEARK